MHSTGASLFHVSEYSHDRREAYLQAPTAHPVVEQQAVAGVAAGIKQNGAETVRQHQSVAQPPSTHVLGCLLRCVQPFARTLHSTSPSQSQTPVSLRTDSLPSQLIREKAAPQAHDRPGSLPVGKAIDQQLHKVVRWLGSPHTRLLQSMSPSICESSRTPIERPPSLSQSGLC